MVALHEAAQSVAWFVVLVFVGIAARLFLDYRKEQKEDSSKFIFDPSQPVKEFKSPRSLSIAKEKHNGLSK